MLFSVTRILIRLLGPKEGKQEVVLDSSSFPCYPDNLLRADKLGGFTMACPVVRSKILDFLHPYPQFKKLLALLPSSLTPKPPPYAACFHLDEQGQVLLQHPFVHVIAPLSLLAVRLLRSFLIRWEGHCTAPRLAWNATEHSTSPVFILKEWLRTR